MLVAVVIASCGNGDDGDEDTSAEPSLEAFCDEVSAYIEQDDFSDEATREAYAAFEAVAPSQIRGDIVTLRNALRGDVVGDTRTVAAGDRFTAYVEQACGIDFVPDEP